MSNNTDNSSQSSGDDKIEKENIKKYKIAKKEFDEAKAESYKKNEDLKNKMFLGCFGLVGIMLSAAAVSNNISSCDFADFTWGVYAAQTIFVILLVFGFHAISVALSIEALSNSSQFLLFISRGKDGDVTLKSYMRLICIAKTIDAICLYGLACWSIYVAYRIGEKFLFSL